MHPGNPATRTIVVNSFGAGLCARAYKIFTVLPIPMSDLIGRRKLLPPVQQALASGMVRILDLSRDLGDVDIQIIGWEPHASTGLGGWIGLKNKAIRERSNLPHHSSLPRI